MGEGGICHYIYFITEYARHRGLRNCCSLYIYKIRSIIYCLQRDFQIESWAVKQIYIQNLGLFTNKIYLKIKSNSSNICWISLRESQLWTQTSHINRPRFGKLFLKHTSLLIDAWRWAEVVCQTSFSPSKTFLESCSRFLLLPFFFF